MSEPEHWNIQLNVQRVTETPEEDAVKRFAQGKPPIKKTTLEVLSLKVAADTEAEAYLKLTRVLTATHPDVIVVPAGETFPLPRPRAIRDNPQA